MTTRFTFILASVLISVSQTGCSIFSPVPLWELSKATGMAVSMAIPYGTTKASNTVYHLHPEFRTVCIEFNADVGTPDIAPALQRELRTHQIESRLYAQGTLIDDCPVWLRYTAVMAWDVPPSGTGYQPYMSAAALTLQSSRGVVLSSSNYQEEASFGRGRWASTQKKLAPVVTALLTGFED